MKRHFGYAAAVCALAGTFFSCGNLEIPESVYIRTAPASIETGLGKVESGSFMSSHTFMNNMQGTGADEQFTLYEYRDSDNPDDMKFLMEYNFEDISMDFSEYISKLNLDEAFSDGFSQELSVAKPDLKFTASNNVDLNEKMLSELKKIRISSFRVPEAGSGNTLTLDDSGIGSNKIPVVFAASSEGDFSFSSADFSAGNLILVIEKGTENPASPDFDFRPSIKIYDKNNNLLGSDSATTNFKDGGYLYIPVDGKSFTQTLSVVIEGTSKEGTLGVAPDYKLNFNFSPSTKIDNIKGLTVPASTLGEAGKINVSKTIPLDDLKNKVISAKIKDGNISIKSQLPEGWENVSCEIDSLTVTNGASGLSLSKSDFVNASSISNPLIDKIADLAGKTIDPSTDISVNATLSLNLSNSTLKFADGGNSITVTGDCKVNKLGETKVDITKIDGFDSSKLSKTVDEPLSSDVAQFIKDITFDSVDFSAGFTGTTLPESDLHVSGKLSSSAFGIDPLSPATGTPVIIKDGNVLHVTKTGLGKTYIIEAPPAVNKIDAKMDIALKGSDALNPDYVTFKEFELGKTYKMNVDVKFKFDWLNAHIKNENTSFSGDIDTKINLKEIFTKTLKLSDSDIAKVNFLNYDESTENGKKGIPLYLYMTKPSTTGGTSPFDKLTVNAVMAPYDGTGRTSPLGGKFLLGTNFTPGSATGKETLPYAKKAPALSEICETEIDGGKSYKKVTASHSELFASSSYSKRIDDFADVVNEKPTDLQMKYDILVSGDGGSDIEITPENIREIEDAGGKTSIQMKMILILPMSIEVTNDSAGGIKLDVLELSESEWHDDFMNRKSKDDYDYVTKHSDAINNITLTYSVNKPLDAHLSFVLDDGSAEVEMLTKNMYFGNSGEASVVYDNVQIKKMIDTYPLNPNVLLNIGKDKESGEKTVLTLPWTVKMKLKAVVNIKEGYEYKIMGD